MNTIPAVVPGSRRPIVLDSKGNLLNGPKPNGDSYPSSKPTATCSSSYRRKPRVTYRSPSSLYPNLRIEGPRQPPPSKPPLSSPHPSDPYYIPLSASRTATRPPLPLYHPLGPLATSLPPIDLETLGLRIADPSKRASSRARKPAAKLREGESAPDTPVVVPVPPPEKAASPRKRRAGGQAGGAKRKRRERDDADPTYPAKRTRTTRPPAQDPSEVDSRADSAPPGGEGDGDGAEGEPLVLPERRSTRSRAAAAKPTPSRRSSVSDETQTSVSVSIAAGRAKKVGEGKDGGENDEVGAEAAAGEVERGSVARDVAPLPERGPERVGDLKDVEVAEARTDSDARTPKAQEPSLPAPPRPTSAPTNARVNGREEDKEEGELSEDEAPSQTKT